MTNRIRHARCQVILSPARRKDGDDRRTIGKPIGEKNREENKFSSRVELGVVIPKRFGVITEHSASVSSS